MRYGAKPLEFEKGKAAIVLKDKTKLVATIEMLIAAVRAGEFDEQLELHLQSQPLRKASGRPRAGLIDPRASPEGSRAWH